MFGSSKQPHPGDPPVKPPNYGYGGQPPPQGYMPPPPPPQPMGPGANTRVGVHQAWLDQTWPMLSKDPFLTGEDPTRPKPPPPPAPENFIAAKVYEGSKAGFTFRDGEYGLGYYADDWKDPEDIAKEKAKEEEAKVFYGPDGMPLEGDFVIKDGKAVIERGRVHHGVELREQGWFQAEPNRADQDALAKRNFDLLTRLVQERTRVGLCADGKWINDPVAFPLPPELLEGEAPNGGIVPFAPHDEQFFICGVYDPAKSSLRSTQVPGLEPDPEANSTWVRLTDFGTQQGSAPACRVFDDMPNLTHYGKIIQGDLNNGYIVEAMQAISMRPKLARSLFYCWDTQLSIFIVRLFMNGVCMRVELDDFVPVGSIVRAQVGERYPIGCRSENFPHVLWPTLVEKAYAKVHTTRREDDNLCKGGWEVLTGGGRVEDALADFTGGVAGRFRTQDVTEDRLFIYIYDLQRYTLFVCRVHERNCDAHGVKLNPYWPHCVNRAILWEGRPYLQVYCGAPGLHDGGLEEITVPWSLINSEEYPEKRTDGFFWVALNEFHMFFDTIFECRLVNSGDVAIEGMPPPRLPGQMPSFDAPVNYMLNPMGPAIAPQMSRMSPMGMPVPPPPALNGLYPLAEGLPRKNHEALHPGDLLPDGQKLGSGTGFQHRSPEGVPLMYFEWVFACPGKITRDNEPEFSVSVPEHQVPCEIIASIDQVDMRGEMTGYDFPDQAAIVVKVYECVDRNHFYSKDLVCKSNWIPIRNAMVAFNCTRGGEFKITAEVPYADTVCQRMVFRCYSSRPGVQVNAAAALRRHVVVDPIEPPRAVKWSFVGSVAPEKLLSTDEPEPFDKKYDSLRQPAFDVHESIEEVCSVM
mmetsp:Transcript_33416/g.76343  ORF Transcript_33416/g.76343 Transcript_33416/m.76343 type:complete len:860 (-) Transcript_33416:80-2659(-)